MTYDLIDWTCPKCGMNEKTPRNAMATKRECRTCRIKRERKWRRNKDKETKANH